MKLQALLKEYLGGYGFHVIQWKEGKGTMEVIEREKPDVILLDIMLPGSDGLDILRDMRKTSSIPVIMLTARGDETDRIVGLELGADDYLPKPFSPRELLARIRAVMRRSAVPLQADPAAMSDIIDADGFALNLSSMTLHIGDGKIELSQTEFRILEALMKRPDTVITRDSLMNIARGRDFIAFERSIDVHISKLRAKVESLSGDKERIRTVWGTGYLFVSRQ